MIACFIRIADMVSAWPKAVEGLAPREQTRALSLRREDDRQRFAIGRYLARTLAGEVVGIAPECVSIHLRCVHCGSADHGQPRAVYPGGTIPVSISHSGQKILVAATEGVDVGADIEQINVASFDPALFQQIESATEAGRTPRNALAFTRLWTLKEAVLKCTGDGLMVSPQTFAIDLSGDPPLLLGGTGRVAVPMALRMFDPGDGYMAAVAVATPGAVELVTVQ